MNQTHPPCTPAPAPPDGHPGFWQLLLPTLGFYVAWAGLALLSHLAGRTTMEPAPAALLIGAVVISNVLLVMVNLPALRSGGDPALAAAQGALTVAWTTVYAVLGEGPGELLPAMYLTAVLTAFMHTDAVHLRRLALVAAGGYALAISIRLLVSPWNDAALGDLLQWVGVAGVLVMLCRHALRAESERGGLSAQVDKLQLEIERLSRNAERDHLTQLFTRQYIMDTLQRETARADRTGTGLSICMFDLDRFKALNDAHGHLTGDRVLAGFSARARRALRGMDMINATRNRRSLGRLGGEEFLAVLPGTDAGGALRCAERVRDAVAREPMCDELQVTVSAGVAEYRPGESISDLLSRADQALYSAKRSGRNRVRVSTKSPRGQTGNGPAKPTLRLVR